MPQEPDNPFQSPATIAHVDEVESQAPDDLAIAIVKGAIRWFLICAISAVPSWLIARSTTAAVISGMATGVFLFAVGYTILDVLTRKHPLRQKPEVKWALAITYGTRIAISLLYPVGFFVDFLCGMIAVSAADFLFDSQELRFPNANFQLQFTSTLMTTLIQGLLLNCVLAGYGLIVYACCEAYKSTTTS